MKLPFKTTPKSPETVIVGDELIGTLEVPKLLDLSVNERLFIREHTKDLPDLRASAVKMARSISNKTGEKLIRTYDALTSGNSEMLGDHLEEFVEFQQLMERSGLHRRLVMATAILRFRLVSEWTLENTGDANQIHPKLVEALADFAQKEESGWQEPEALATDEDLGKSLPPWKPLEPVEEEPETVAA